MDKSKMVVTLRINSDIIKKIDDIAYSFGVSRNAYINMVLGQSLKQQQQLEKLLDKDNIYEFIKNQGIR